MKIRVENLAKIKEAEIDIKNLTLFVGQNSTHKSYMAHCIYEFYKEASNLKNDFGVTSIRFTNIISKKVLQNNLDGLEYLLTLKKELKEDEDYYQNSEDEWEHEISTILRFHIDRKDKKIISFINDINSLIFLELTQKINNSFNINKTILKKLQLDNSIESLKSDVISISYPMPLEHFKEEDNQEETKYKIINNIVRSLIDELYQQLNNYNSSYYFPASRTGFVLTLDEIYAGIFRDKFRGQVSATRLGEPTIDFIQTFADIKTGKGIEKPYLSTFLENKKSNITINKKLVDFLETNLIKGKITEVRNDQDYASYYLNVNGEVLDLHLASSATLETLPFIVFLKNTQDISKTFFVIEEPEAHLHPKAQMQMTKFIVMLSNTGAKVLVTTHSDYILNEINNCIKLDSLNKDDEFAISKDDVSAYLFRNEENETTVSKLEIDRFGIANDNFDEVLDELLDRSSELSEKILDND